MNTPAQPVTALVDEFACAAAIRMSVSWLRNDRRTKRIVPVIRIGTSIRYDMDRVLKSLSKASA